MPDLFDEVGEDLRADRMRALALRYGGLAIAAVLAVVLATAGWQAWDWYSQRRMNTVADTYFEGLRLAGAPGGDHADATAAFVRIDSTGFPAFRTLARLREAALRADAGDRDAALKLWDAVANDAAADNLLRGLANLMWAEHQLDSADPAVLRARLAGLTDPRNAWHGLAQEALALLDLRDGHAEDAKRALERLALDPQVPEGVRGRANMLLAGLGG